MWAGIHKQHQRPDGPSANLESSDAAEAGSARRMQRQHALLAAVESQTAVTSAITKGAKSVLCQLAAINTIHCVGWLVLAGVSSVPPGLREAFQTAHVGGAGVDQIAGLSEPHGFPLGLFRPFGP